VAVIDGGTIVAQGTPGSLGGRGRAAVEVGFSLRPPWQPNDLPEPVREAGVSRDGTRVVLRAESVPGARCPVPGARCSVHWAEASGVDLADLEVLSQPGGHLPRAHRWLPLGR
jgi:ABC-2 type transport system ATP-binding protein